MGGEWLELAGGSSELMVSTRIKIVVDVSTSNRAWQYQVHYGGLGVGGSGFIYPNEGVAKRAGILFLQSWLSEIPVEVDRCIALLKRMEADCNVPFPS